MAGWMSGEYLSRIYRIADWKDDPYTEAGRRRYREALDKFRSIVAHPWLSELEREPRVLDLCAGGGIGGVALSKVLLEKGYKPRLCLVDLRGDALQAARKFCSDEGVGCVSRQMDAAGAHEIGKFDVVLLYGAPLAHFDPWRLMRLLASVSAALEETGLLILEEMDRVNKIFIGGFKHFIVEASEPGRLSVSVHGGYNRRRGAYRRIFYDVLRGHSAEVFLSFYSESIIGAMAWAFFRDLDFVEFAEGTFMLLARAPRGALSPVDFSKLPRAIMHQGEPTTSPKSGQGKVYKKSNSVN